MKSTAPLLKGLPLKHHVRLKTPTVFRNALILISIYQFSKVCEIFMYKPEGDSRLPSFHIIHQTAVQWHCSSYLKLLRSFVKRMLK